ncbi:MAG: SNF2-related protein [Phocaeicola sp.]
MKYTPHQHKYFAWELTRRRGSSDDEKLTAVLSEAQVDLNPHQVEAALFAFRSPLSMGSILADEVGLGKTIEAALVISQQWAERKRHILIIVPATLRKQWSVELEEKFFLPSIILERKNFNAILNESYKNPFDNSNKIIICSYQFAKKQISHIRGVSWDLVVLDEAHKLRNVYKASNKTAIVLKESLQPFKKLMLTATPLQNDIKELYGLISIIDDNYFGNLQSFGGQYNKVALRDDSSYQELRHRIRPVVHRTLRSDVQEYVKYTERTPMVQEYAPSDVEVELAKKVTSYLQREACYGLPKGQRSLITLVLHKLLSSSSFAIAGTLQTIIDRLEKRLLVNSEEVELLEEAIESNFELFEEYVDEWGDEESEEVKDDVEVKEQLTLDEIEEIKTEIKELKEFHQLALSIAVNSKGECLLKALTIAFENKRSKGEPEKALIFTESTRTQDYIKQLLERNGYRGKIVLFNGSNTDGDSKKIYKSWLEANANSSKITGSATADKRQALVDYFKQEAQIMIATEAASEGINLQFCSLLINYDLPWNPQRVEQRIGRCHRYRQKSDVVVVNFINKKNRADQRVYELLDQKFNLFKGVFGASDDVLGKATDSLDFERQILEIYQKCRNTEEIDAEFDALQERMRDRIDETLDKTRRSLLEHFDEDVVSKLRIRKDADQERLSLFNKLLWELTIDVLGHHITIKENNNAVFRLNNSPDSHLPVPLGSYQLGKSTALAYNYRLSHPLAHWVVNRSKETETPATHLLFDYSNHPAKISLLGQHVGNSGYLSVVLIQFTSLKEYEEHLIYGVVDDTGKLLDDEFAKKLLSLSASSIEKVVIENTEILVNKLADERIKLYEQLENRNALYVNEEIAKIECWAEDKSFALEQELKEIKKSLREKTRQAKLVGESQKMVTLQREVQGLSKLQRTKRNELFEVEDEIERRRDEIITQIADSLKQQVVEKELFTIRWTLK